MTVHDQAGARPATAPVLRTSAILLRALAEHDVPALVEQERDPQVRRWSPTTQPFGAPEAGALVQSAREQWAARSATAPRRWAIGVGAGESWYADYAGQVEYVPDGRGAAEVGFVVHPGHRGRGLSVQALALALAHAHTEDSVHTVHWRSEVGNWASRRVVWRLGFRVEGLVRGIVPGPDHPRPGWWGTRQVGDPVEPVHRWWDVPELASAGVVLRPVTATSRGLPDATTQGSTPDPAAAADATAPDDPVAAALSGAAAGASVTWFVAGSKGDALTGRLTVAGLDDPRWRGCGQVSWWWPDADAGSLAAALQLVAAHAFEPAPPLARPDLGGLGLHRLDATVEATDRTARRVMHGAGWRAVGREHAARTPRGSARPVDTVRFELLAPRRPATGDQARPVQPVPPGR